MTNNHVNKSLMGTYKIRDMIVDTILVLKLLKLMLQMKRYINSIT